MGQTNLEPLSEKELVEWRVELLPKAEVLLRYDAACASMREALASQYDACWDGVVGQSAILLSNPKEPQTSLRVGVLFHK